MSLTASSIEILGVPVACMDRATALARIEELALRQRCARVFYVNAHSLNLASRDATYRSVLREADVVLNDGFGLSLAARVQRRRFPANLNGSDFNPLILQMATRRGWRVFLLGGRPGVAQRAGERLVRSVPHLDLVGTHHGFLPRNSHQAIVREIAAAETDVLMVAMGNPAQELWLQANLEATGARLGIGVGAFFDFTAGQVPRAPRLMNRLGMEWLFRLAQEPRRMWRRYLVGNPTFLARVAKERFWSWPR